jgi:hypothetical protein
VKRAKGEVPGPSRASAPSLEGFFNGVDIAISYSHMFNSILRVITVFVLVSCLQILGSDSTFAENCNVAAGESCSFSEQFDYFLPSGRPNNPSFKYDEISSILKSRTLTHSASNLTEEEKVALFGFTQEYYIPVNSEIRQRSNADRIPTYNYDFYIQILDSALLKLHPFQGVTTRDVDLPANVSADHYIGNIVKYAAYTSSSRISAGRDNWRYYKTHLHFVIKSLTGRNIENYSAKPEEQEVLFLRNTQFKVEDRKEIDCTTQRLPKNETCYEIHLQEVKDRE